MRAVRPRRRRVITPKVLRAALAQVDVTPPAPRSLAQVIRDAIDVGYATFELAHPMLQSTAPR